MAAVEGCKDPWLCRVEVDALYTLAPGKELPLDLQRHGVSDCYDPFSAARWDAFGNSRPARARTWKQYPSTMPGVYIAPLKLFHRGRTGPWTVRLGCAYLDVEPHAGQVLSISWLECRRGLSFVVDSRFTVGRMSMADKPAWREGDFCSGAQSRACSTRDRSIELVVGRVRWQGLVGVGRADVMWVVSLWVNSKLLPRLRELSEDPLPIEMWSLGSSALGEHLLA